VVVRYHAAFAICLVEVRNVKKLILGCVFASICVMIVVLAQSASPEVLANLTNLM
jgi:hypothetical protein